MVERAVGLKKVMRRVWAQALPDIPFQPNATWDEIGIDSLKAFEVVLRLEKALGARLPVELFSLESTASDVVRILARRPAQPSPRQGTLAFLVPGLFGASPLLAKLTSAFEGQVAFETVAFPGLGAPARVLGDVGGLAALVVDQIQARQPKGEVRIVGYSTGGLIACEAASRLERSGRRVAALCAIDTPLPSRLENLAPRLMETLLPILAARSAMREHVAAIQALAGGRSSKLDLAQDVESQLFRLYLQLGLLERARRLLIGATDRRDASWTSACRKHLFVRLSFRSALAWRPTPCRAPMLLIAGDQLQMDDGIERWRRAYPQIEVVKVRGAHTKLFEPGVLAHYKPALLGLLDERAPAREAENGLAAGGGQGFGVA